MRARSLLTLLVAAIAVAPAGAAGPSWARVKAMPHPPLGARGVRGARLDLRARRAGHRGRRPVRRESRWRRETTLPGGIVNAPAAVVALGRKLYVVGGFLGLVEPARLERPRL
jgi:hypothetical protein